MAPQLCLEATANSPSFAHTTNAIMPKKKGALECTLCVQLLD
jgi:hypothetical protein